MTQDQAVELMRLLKRGFGRADREAMNQAISEDFEWRMHWCEEPADAPTGKVLRGLDQVMDEIARRQASWTDLRYDNMVEHYLPDLVVQTFTVSGVDETGTAFKTEAVDLYTLGPDRIESKRTYWKQPPAR